MEHISSSAINFYFVLGKKNIIILQSNYEINGMAPLCKTELATPIKGTFFFGGGGLNSLEADSGEGKGFCWLLGDDNGIL